ncbi:hypothetical protein GGI20_001784 [Coemansia sp. BCRC 34301]|nr:hypothetical protein GGI20_001784 [Coemansia sp. BCRC 34301]
MSAHSPEVAIAGACAGIIGLVGVVLAIAAAVRHRSRLESRSRNELEEEGAAVCAPALAVVVVNETQPLLSESAIRTRYANNPNEFARSYIDRPQHSSYVGPRSLGGSPAGMPYSPAENIVIVAPSDISDSEDSGIESCVSTHSDKQDAVHLEATSADSVVATVEPQPADKVVDAATSVSTPACAPFMFSQPVACMHAGDAPSTEQACLTGPAETVDTLAPNRCGPGQTLTNAEGLLVPQVPAADGVRRPRSSTLSARARVFVPGSRSRTMVDASGTSIGELKDRPAPTGNVSPKLIDNQVQALGQSTQSSTRSSLSESKTDVDADKTDGERQPSTTNETTGSAEAEPGTTFIPNRRCRFWPSCNNKNCKYSHPSRTCMMYPNCTYGEHCVFIHPCDAQRINDVISRGKVKRNRRKKNRDLVRLNNISDFVE